jgi:hypothetical protein
MTWQLCLLRFPLRFLVIFTFWFSQLFSLLFRSLWIIILSFVILSVSWLFVTPSCVHFLNYFKEGEETFCSLNVYFPEACWGGADCCRGEGES